MSPALNVIRSNSPVGLHAVGGYSQMQSGADMLMTQKPWKWSGREEDENEEGDDEKGNVCLCRATKMRDYIGLEQLRKTRGCMS